MGEFFVVANSNAAPFFSDTDSYFVKGKTWKDALNKAVAEYEHPCGLFALGVWKDANSYHTGGKPLGRWLSERAGRGPPK